jgi:hypothetical protein
MKTILLLICCFVLLVGCAAETQDEAINLPPEPAVPGTEDIAVDDVVVEDQVVVDTEDIAIEVVDDVVEVDMKNSATADTSSFTFADCIPGDTYAVDQEGVTGETIFTGLKTFKGKQWCHADSVFETQGITVTTEYYVSEGITEMWVVADVMGQVTETHIVN